MGGRVGGIALSLWALCKSRPACGKHPSWNADTGPGFFPCGCAALPGLSYLETSHLTLRATDLPLPGVGTEEDLSVAT